MTEDCLRGTSKFPKKLFRDVFMATDIGRDSPFDPFKNGDITALFASKKERSAGLMYFAQKPLRRCPAPVNYAKMPDPRKGLQRIRPAITDALYDPPLPPTTHNVVIPTSPRFPVQARKGVHSCRNNAPMESAKPKGESGERAKLKRKVSVDFLDGTFVDADALKKLATDKPRELFADTEAREGASHAPTFRLMAGREPKSNPAKGGSGSPRRKLYTVFPWENGAKQDKRATTAPAPTPHASPTKVANPQMDRSEVSASPASPASPSKVEEDAKGIEKALQDLDEEEWGKARKALIARYGLVTGGGRKERLRRKPKSKGLDFTGQPGRNAPMSWATPHMQPRDVTYDVNFGQLTKERKVLANVHLGRYANRSSNSAPYLETANRVMEYTHLLRFHKKKQIEAQRSALALPGSHSSQGLNERPLTAADDLWCHNASLYAPVSVVTRLLPGNPDLALYADRADEPLSAVLGGDRKRYERAAKASDLSAS